MGSIRELLAADHRHCDDLFAAAERFVAAAAWADADLAFGRLQRAMLDHFDAEEAILFPAFEAETGMRMGPTQVMRGEHAQIRALLEAADVALAAHDADEYLGNAETLLIMTQQHNMKEENILYPMCDQHLMARVETLVPQLKGGISLAERV